MSKDCTCPICRFCRNELSVGEMAWYLKGSIEHQSHYLDLIKNATSLEELREKVKHDKCDLDGDYLFLTDLKSNDKRNPDKWWDVAMDYPTSYVLPKGDKEEHND